MDAALRDIGTVQPAFGAQHHSRLVTAEKDVTYGIRQVESRRAKRIGGDGSPPDCVTADPLPNRQGLAGQCDATRHVTNREHQGRTAHGEVDAARSERDRYHFGTFLQLESETKARLRPLLQKYGLPFVEGGEAKEAIDGFVSLYTDNDWSGFGVGFPDSGLYSTDDH